jgi:hypothetical protein
VIRANTLHSEWATGQGASGSFFVQWPKLELLAYSSNMKTGIGVMGGLIVM